MTQDDLPADGLPHVRRSVRRELGAPLEALFSDFDAVPLASASVAQAHYTLAHAATPRTRVHMHMHVHMRTHVHVHTHVHCAHARALCMCMHPRVLMHRCTPRRCVRRGSGLCSSCSTAASRR